MYSTTFSSRFSRPATRRCGSGSHAAVRATAAFAGFALGLGLSLTISGSLHAKPGPAALAGRDAEETRPSASAPLPSPPALRLGILGSLEIKLPAGLYARQWADLRARIEGERGVYEACARGETCAPGLKAWRKLLVSLNGKPRGVQLEALNRWVNAHVAYADDEAVYGTKDHWATPAEALTRKGDCEDYAILKFFSLLELGFDNDQLRMAIVADTRRRILHAVVTVAMDDKTYVLDSLFGQPVQHHNILKYHPRFSANLTDQWAHIVTAQIRRKFALQVEQALAGRDVAAFERPVQGDETARPAARRGGLGILAKTPAFGLQVEADALRAAWT